MTTTVKQNLDALEQSVKANRRALKKRLPKNASPAVVFSAAKYYAVIEKLAKE